MTRANTGDDTSMRGRMRWLWKEGLVRRVIAEKQHRRVVDIPLTAFLIAAVLAPWLVALGGVAGILLGYQFRVEREEPAVPGTGEGGAPSGADPGEDSPDGEAPGGTTSG